MTDSLHPFVIGGSREERLRTFLEVALSLREKGVQTIPRRWRGRVVEEIARKYNLHGKHTFIDMCLNNLGGALLRQIRKTFLGDKEQEESETMEVPKNDIPEPVQFPDSRAGRLALFLKVAADLHATATVKAHRWRFLVAQETARRCGIDCRGVIDIYTTMSALGRNALARIRAACLGETTIPADADSAASPGNGSGLRDSSEDSEPDTSVDKVRLEIYARYTNVIANAAPEARNRSAIAQSMGLELFIVDSYLYQHRELAMKLDDGYKAISFRSYFASKE